MNLSLAGSRLGNNSFFNCYEKRVAAAPQTPLRAPPVLPPPLPPYSVVSTVSTRRSTANLVL